MMKLEHVLNEVKALYPKITDEEIHALVNEALQQKTIQEVIINYICFVKTGRS